MLAPKPALMDRWSICGSACVAFLKISAGVVVLSKREAQLLYALLRILFQDHFCLDHGTREPWFAISLREQCRHSERMRSGIMDAAHELVAWQGNERAAFDDFAIWFEAAVPQCGKSKQFLVGEFDQERDFSFPGPCATHRNQRRA